MISRLLGGFCALGIGVALYPMVSKELAKVPIADIPNWGSMVLKLVPGFFAIAILAAGIAIVYGALRDIGIFGDMPEGDYQEEYKEEVKKDPNRKQTYKEYVQEQLEAQDMIHHASGGF